MPIERLQLEDKEIMIVGTAHVSKSSVEETRSAIAEFQPDVVAIELCQNRYSVMRNPKTWAEMDIVKVIKEKKALLLFANLIMSAVQKRMGDKFGVRPGEEMRAAIEEADKAGIPLAPVDRSVQITLKRAWNSLSFWEKNKFLFSILFSVLGMDELKEEDIEELKTKDMLTQAVGEIARQAPTIKRVLIDERDAYMARKILDADGRRVLAVVGAGHMEGLLKQIASPIDDVSPLEEVPVKRGVKVSWILLVALLALVSMGFFHGTPKQGFEMLKWWIVCSSTTAGLGALAALAHPVTIIVAIVTAPVTAVNPAVRAGWVAGLCEAYLKKPKVSDFERLPEDIVRVRGWWSNPITRILLVVMLVNLSTLAGVVVAMPILTRIAIHG
jgi:pheromone shutdown-related protein TraB